MSEFSKKLLPSVRRTLRESSTEFDDEIESYIDTCATDLQNAGILSFYFDPTRDDWSLDNQILQAVRWYCLSVYGLYNTDSEKYERAYSSLKSTLATQTKYSKDYTHQSSDSDKAEIERLRAEFETLSGRFADLKRDVSNLAQDYTEHKGTFEKAVNQAIDLSNNASQSAVNAQGMALNAQNSAVNAQNSANEAQETAGHALGVANESQGTSAVALQIANEAFAHYQKTAQDLSEHKAAYERFKKAVETILNGDDVDLDQLSEIVAYIKSNKSLIDNITINKVNVGDIVDDLLTVAPSRPLSANQGFLLKQFVDQLFLEKLNISDVLNTLTSEEVTKALSAKQGFVLKTHIDNLSSYVNDISEWDYILDLNAGGYTADIQKLYGNVLVKGGSMYSDEYIGTNINHLRFEGTTFPTDFSFYGSCKKISGIEATTSISFGEATAEVCDCIAYDISAENCAVHDVVATNVIFRNCRQMRNIKVSGTATYTNCKFVDPFTCEKFGSGVPMIDGNGAVTFIESAEGGSYGS